MQSLIIIQVEHAEDTDNLQAFTDYMISRAEEWNMGFIDYSVKIDIPECFRL